MLPRAWHIVLYADDDFAKPRALTLIKDTNLSMLKILQSIARALKVILLNRSGKGFYRE